MPSPAETALAAALQRAPQIARERIVRSQDISRSDRELLVSQHWLREIIRGWYLLTTPEAQSGDTVIWHSSFWAFVAAYLRERFDRRCCLSAEASLDLWSGAMGTPRQLTVLTASGGSSRIELPTGTSILTYQNASNLPRDIVELNGVQVMSLGTALVRTTPTFFHLDPLTAEIALRRDGMQPAPAGSWVPFPTLNGQTMLMPCAPIAKLRATGSPPTIPSSGQPPWPAFRLNRRTPAG